MPKRKSNWPFPLEVRERIYEHLFHQPNTITMHPKDVLIREYNTGFLKFGIDTAIFGVNKAISGEAQVVFKRRGFMLFTVTKSYTAAFVRQIIPSKIIAAEQKCDVPSPLEIAICNESHVDHESYPARYGARHGYKYYTLVFDLRYLDRLVDVLNAFRANHKYASWTGRDYTTFREMEITVHPKFDNLGGHDNILGNSLYCLKSLQLGLTFQELDRIGGQSLRIDILSDLDEKDERTILNLAASICQPSYEDDSSIEFLERLERKAESFLTKGDLVGGRAYYLITFTCLSDSENGTLIPFQNIMPTSLFRCSHIETHLGLRKEARRHATEGFEYSQWHDIPIPFEEVMAYFPLAYEYDLQDSLEVLETAWGTYTGEEEKAWTKREFDVVVEKCKANERLGYDLEDIQDFAPELAKTIVTALPIWNTMDQNTEAG